MRKRWLLAGAVALAAPVVLVAPVIGMVMVTGMSTEQAASPGGAVPIACGQPAGVAAALESDEQRQNAKTIITFGVSLGVPERGLVVAIATALQESTLRNLKYGDRDSQGLFQQRPASGWGTPEQITNPELSAAAFFGQAKHTSNPGLLDIPGWEVMTIAGAAQAVQRSAFPDAYAQHEALAATVVQQVLGSGPAEDCTPEGAPGACGAPTDLSGYQNGRIPASALCKVAFAPEHMLRSDAALALERLNVAYRERFGADICITDSYRDYATQVRLKAEKGGLAATPGTSNHGWGQALDLCGGINTGGVEYDWMRLNAPRYGWENPEWARPGGSGPLERWHWEMGT